MEKEVGSLARGETTAFLASSLAGKFASCLGEYRQGKYGHIRLKIKLLNCSFHQLQEAPRCPAVASACCGWGGKSKPGDFTGDRRAQCKTHCTTRGKTPASRQSEFSLHPSPKPAPGNSLQAEIHPWASLISNAKWEQSSSPCEPARPRRGVLILFFRYFFPIATTIN